MRYSILFVLLLSFAVSAQDADSIKAYNQSEIKIEKKAEFSGVLSLNSAPADSLVLLPGIGEVTAQRIIDARPFRSLYELLKVKGIGEKKFRKLYPYIKL